MIPLVRIRNGHVRCHSRISAVVPLRPHRNTAQFYVPKTISRAASDLIAIRRAHRFSIRIKNSTRWRISANHFHPENLWHSTSNSFATEGQDGFTAAIDIFLKGKIYTSEWNPTTGKDDVEWLDVWWPGFHISLGLAQLVSQSKGLENESDSELEPLEPWAAIYRNNTYSTLGLGLSPQDRGRTSQFRKRAEQLPTTLNLTHPYIQQTRSYTTKAKRYSKDHSLLLSVSTNVLPHRESGMYELVLSIKEASLIVINSMTGTS